MASVLVSSGMISTVSPSGFGHVTCDGPAHRPTRHWITWMPVRREVWSARPCRCPAPPGGWPFPSGGPVKLLRSARFPAVLLLVAAGAGLIIANTAIGPAVIEFSHAHLAVPATAIDLSLTHWVSDGLLVFFFFMVSIELQYELTRGELRSARRAVQPALAAAGGVIVPIVIYLIITAGSGFQEGWPIPTATDIAFALGVLAVFGRGLPSGVRVFLLALAIIDDVVGIVFIAVLFATDLNFGMLTAGLVTTAVFGILSRLLHLRGRPWIIAALVVLAVATWAFILLSGVHATIAGVLLGLAMAQTPALVTRHAMEPWVNAVILPLFAF